MRATLAFLLVGGIAAASAVVAGCSAADDSASSASADTTCTNGLDANFRFPNGDANGHADPLGAAAAKQSRAGRITSQSQIFQPGDARHRVHPGDFVLANEKIAVYIEAESQGTNLSDGYFNFGGEILGLEPIGADNKPLGVSHYGETVVLFGMQTVAPDKVTVLNDGSDGKAAIVRASGVLKLIPALDAFVTFFPDQYNFPVALDYVLEPGASQVTLRYSLANTRSTAVSFAQREHLGVFQQSFSQTFTEVHGYAPSTPAGTHNFIAWDDGVSSWLYKAKTGPSLTTFLSTQGFEAYQSPPQQLAACAQSTTDYLDVVVGGPGIDGLLEAKRANYGEPAWHAVSGVVKEQNGGPLAGAIVHATTAAGYLTRATTDANGNYTIHVPTQAIAGSAVSLTATMKGWAVPAAQAIADSDSNVTLTLPQSGTLDIIAKDADTGDALPVRVQIIPDNPIAKSPPSFGVVTDEPDDRFYREYALNGRLTVPVPPGGYRVVVTRGYEYELSDTPIDVTAGKTSAVLAALKHSVDSTNTMCADFHIHSIYSADSPDPVTKKVSQALADGLEIPVSSEHEYIIDFQPIVKQLGMTKWALGMSSEELTTFKYGHFGVFPLPPQPDVTNNGAYNWAYETPAQILPAVTTESSQPMLIVNHPRGSMGYFDLTGYSRDTGKGKDGLWSDNFGAIEVFNDSDLEANRTASVADWFGILNAGRKMPATGSSDSHHLSSNPLGYPRTCLALGTDDPTQITPVNVRDALRQGAAVISGGITMTAQGPDGTGPGGTSQAGSYKVTIASPSWVTPSTLEVIVDGTTTQTLTLDPTQAGAGPGKLWTVNVNVAASTSKPQHWVVFHAKSGTDLAPLHPGKNAFAVSNAIYF